MENTENKVLVITNVVNGVCVNDPFITLVNDLTSSLRRTPEYFKFDKDPIDPTLTDSVAKDTLDRLYKLIGDYEFIMMDDRLSKNILNLIIGFILSNGNQIGSFVINNEELREFVESKILLRKGIISHEPKTLLVVCPDGEVVEEAVQISEAIDELVTTSYDKIKFLDGIYNEESLYRVLGYCYNVGTIVIDSNLPENPFIKVIVSKW